MLIIGSAPKSDLD